VQGIRLGPGGNESERDKQYLSLFREFDHFMKEAIFLSMLEEGLLAMEESL
jgi:hypothetical protein